MADPAKRRPRVTVLGVLAVLALLSAAGAAVCIWVILGRSTNPLWSRRANVLLPDLVGLSRTEAEALPETAALAVTWEEVYNPAVEPGLVCGQDPAAGRTVKEGQALTIQISLGTNWQTMPDLTGADRTQALETLREMGLQPTVEFWKDNTMDPYTVVRTEPAAGTRVAAGEAVKLVVVRPIPDPFRPVPNLAGLEVAEARARLQEVGLTAVVSSNRAEGTVTNQDPVPGTLLRVFGTVRLYVG